MAAGQRSGCCSWSKKGLQENHQAVVGQPIESNRMTRYVYILRCCLTLVSHNHNVAKCINLFQFRSTLLAAREAAACAAHIHHQKGLCMSLQGIKQVTPYPLVMTNTVLWNMTIDYLPSFQVNLSIAL